MVMTEIDKDKKMSRGSDYCILDYNVVPSEILYTSTHKSINLITCQVIHIQLECKISGLLRL